MPNVKKGTEPPCPLQYPGCLGVVVTYRATVCQNCAALERRRKLRNDTVEPRESAAFEVKGDDARVMQTTSEKVKTLADLVRICQIDTHEWDIVEWACKASQQSSVPRATRPAADQKWLRPSTEPVLTQMFHVSAKLRRKSATEKTLVALQAGLLADIRTEVKRAHPPRTARRFVDGGWLFEFTPFDLHMGKYTWDEETVTNYDVDRAEDLFNAALDFLLAQAVKLADGKLARVLCVFGNDVSHMDSKRGRRPPARKWTSTPATRVSTDGSARFIAAPSTSCATSPRSTSRSCRATTTS
jgi:hypothetical protein